MNRFEFFEQFSDQTDQLEAHRDIAAHFRAQAAEAFAEGDFERASVAMSACDGAQADLGDLEFQLEQAASLKYDQTAVKEYPNTIDNVLSYDDSVATQTANMLVKSREQAINAHRQDLTFRPMRKDAVSPHGKVNPLDPMLLTVHYGQPVDNPEYN